MNESRKTERLAGHIVGNHPGPLMILVGGLHGNETAGVAATERILEQLNPASLHGEVIGLRGNLAALAAGRRFVDYDLNRCWTDEHLHLLHSDAEATRAEDKEAMALLACLDRYTHTDHPTKLLVDLHTTSARGSFVIVPEAHAHHVAVEALRIPIVTGMENFLRGTLMVHAVENNWVSFAFEGGQIGSPEAIDLHEAGIWSMLHTLEMLSLPDDTIAQHRQLLNQQAQALPHRVVAKSMHLIAEGSDFRMNPGYYNFKSVHLGEVLAHDKDGPIASPQDGMIFMPLYQKEGNDGFFIVEEL